MYICINQSINQSINWSITKFIIYLCDICFDNISINKVFK